jgi:hypothetical protein
VLEDGGGPTAGGGAAPPRQWVVDGRQAGSKGAGCRI